MTEKNLNDLLWSVDRTVRRVLDSQEIKNLGHDIADSLDRVGESFRPIFEDRDHSGRTPGNMSGQTGGYRNTATGRNASNYSRPSYQQGSSGRSRSTPSGWKQAGRADSWSSVGTQRTPQAGRTEPYRAKVVKREPGWQRGGAIALSMFGGLAAIGGGVLALDMLGGLLFGYMDTMPGIFFGTIFGLIAAAGVAVTALGCGKLSEKNRMKKIWNFLKRRDFCKVSEIAEKVGMTEKKVVRLLEKMIDKKYLQECYFDEQQTCVMMTGETYQRYLESREERRAAEAEARRQQQDPEKAALAKTVKEGSDYIRRIREINNDLPDPVISGKLDDLERVCQQIFAYVADHPDKLASIRKFISYYLPTTLKLLEAYRNLERRNTGVASEQKTKEEILSALDNIILAFHNLLDDLMENDYLDLSADITVLQSMLQQEGLVDDFAAEAQKKTHAVEDAAAEAELETGADLFSGIELKLDDQFAKEYEPELRL